MALIVPPFPAALLHSFLQLAQFALKFAEFLVVRLLFNFSLSLWDMRYLDSIWET